MTRPIIIISAALLTVILCVSIASSQALTFKRQPNSAKECAICHYEMIELFVFDNKNTDIALYPKSKEVSSDRMCFSCHDGSVGDSRLRVWDMMGVAHKTGTPLQEGMAKRSDLPLVDGKITCMTCHTAHGEQQDGKGFTDIANSLFLRMANDSSQLCKSCHTDKGDEDSHSMKELDKNLISTVTSLQGYMGPDGKMTCLSCHTVHGAKMEKLTIENDKDMTLCKVCHSDLFNNVKNHEKLNTPHVDYSLPLDKSVTDAVAKNSGVLGADGGLVCYSCHKIHNAKGGSAMLSASVGVNFCGECHKGFEKVGGGSHDLSNIKGYKTNDGKTVAEVGTCGTCHSGHTWRLGGKNVSADKVTDLCITCHNPTGPAAKKVVDLNKFNHFTGDIDPKFFDMKVPANAKDLSISTETFLKAYLSNKKALKTVFADKRMTCVTCHDVHTDGKMFVREDAFNGTLCVSCHEEKKNTLTTPHGDKKVAGNCLGCHDVHNSADKGLVRNGAIDDGCITCHSKDGTVAGKLPRGMNNVMPQELVYKVHNHPSGIDNATVFPAPAYNKQGGKFSCVSCHDPHVSDAKSVMKGNFVRTDSKMKSADDFCIVCHDKEKAVMDSSHTPDPKKKIVANKRTGRVAGTCDKCHSVHNAFGAKGIPSVNSVYNTPDDLCLNCHKENGDAKDKKIEMSKGHKTGLLDEKPKDAPLEYITMENGKFYLRCVTCHDPHLNGPKAGEDGDISNSFLKRLDSQINICVSCHEDKGRIKTGGHGVANFENKTKEVKARIRVNDTCGSCHVMHNSNPEYLMAGVTDKDRCMSCHDKGQMSEKVVSMSHRTDVEIKDKDKDKLPLENGRMTCKTCHQVHNATKDMIRSDNGKGETLCGVCHDDKTPVLESKHNMRINGVKDGEIEKLAAESACEPCHSSHDPNRKTSIAIGTVSQEGFLIEDHCVTCHTKRGPASDSVPESLRHSSIMKTLKSMEKLAPFMYDAAGKKSAIGDIGCSTCHDPHVWSMDKSKVKQFYKAGLKVEGDNTTYFLKNNVSGEFCGVCHEDSQTWFNNFHSEKYREERINSKQPSSLLERTLKLFK